MVPRSIQAMLILNYTSQNDIIVQSTLKINIIFAES